MSFPTSYIPTTTATVTRNADQLSITGDDFSEWYNQTEGTVVCDFLRTVIFESGKFPGLFSFLSSSAERITGLIVSSPTKAYFSVRTSDTFVADMDIGSY